MDRIQRSGLIALILLLGVGTAGILMGPRKVTGTDAFPAEVKLNPGELPAVDPVPPSRRQLSFGADRFAADPVEHPLEGGGGRSINDSSSWSPGAARSVAADLTPPDLRAEPASADSAEVSQSGGATIIDLEDDVVITPASMESPMIVLRTIRVREGETLSEIAKRELGSTKHVITIANFNNLKDINSISLGQELKIPDLSKSGQPATASGVKTGTDFDQQEISSQWRTYTVGDGDIGGRISQKMYGTTKYWKQIMEANGIVDSRSLRPGQVLRIPPLSTLPR